jgi:hypothetical protein
MSSEEAKHLAAVAMVAWLLIIIFFMAIAQNMDLEFFFIFWLLGLIVIIVLIEPHHYQPPYMRYLKYIAAGGVAMYGVIMAHKVLEILNT